MRAPGSAAKHLVVRTPEDRGVFRIRKRCEPRVSPKVRGGPFPHIPEQIAALPASAFYITRDTLPLAALPAWIAGGFFPKQLAILANPADAAVFVALLAAMVGASALVLWLDRRLARA